MKVLLQYLLETSLSGPAHSCSRNRCEIPYIVHSPVAGTRGGGSRCLFSLPMRLEKRPDQQAQQPAEDVALALPFLLTMRTRP